MEVGIKFKSVKGSNIRYIPVKAYYTCIEVLFTFTLEFPKYNNGPIELIQFIKS